MSMMGELKFFLGIQINQSPRGIFINQAKYAQEILIKHGMTSCDSIGTPMATKHLDADLSGTLVDQTKYHSMVGALMYLTTSRPDIMHATCYCARYQAKPTEKHLTAVRRIFWYLKDTIHMGIWYPKDTGFELTAFSDSDHAVCLDSRKSTSGGIQFLGGDKLVSWSSKSRTSLQCLPQKPTIAISCNPVQHSRTKCIDVRYHFIKEKVKKGIVELFFVGTEYQLADLFTKALPEERFKYLVRRLAEQEKMPEMEPFMKHAEKSTETDRENLFNDDSKADDNNRSVENVAGESRHSDGAFSDGSMVVLRGRHYKEGESFGIIYVPRIINTFDGDDLAFQCMIGFMKFTAYLDPFLPMNIISRKAYNTIMVEGLESTGKNLVAVVRDVYVFVVDVVFDGAFGGVGDKEVVVGEGVVVTYSSLEMLTNSCLGGIMVSLIFLEGLVEEASEEFMVELFEKDDKMSKKVFAKVNGAFVVAHDGNVIESYVVVDESLFHP
nr:ribonuclease H-like domain-containing protein [Tanacetum cinerariifolium]